MTIDRNPFHSLMLNSILENKDKEEMLSEMFEMVTKNITFNEIDFPYWAIVFDSLLDTIKSQMDKRMLREYEEARKDITVVAIKKEGEK